MPSLEHPKISSKGIRTRFPHKKIQTPVSPYTGQISPAGCQMMD